MRVRKQDLNFYQNKEQGFNEQEIKFISINLNHSSKAILRKGITVKMDPLKVVLFRKYYKKSKKKSKEKIRNGNKSNTKDSV